MQNKNQTLAFFKQRADAIPNWVEMSKKDVVTKYIENENTEMADNWLAVVVCKYWHKVYENHFDFSIDLDEYIAWTIEGIMKALKYRSWMDEDKKISLDPAGIDKTINRCIKTVFINHIYLNGMDKRVVNHNSISLDATLNGTSVSLDKMLSTDNELKVDACSDIVQNYIDKKDYLSALILDNICYQDSFKDSKLSKRKVVNNLINSNDNYTSYLTSTYANVDEDILNDTFDYIKSVAIPVKANNKKLYDTIDKVLSKVSVKYNTELGGI